MSVKLRKYQILSLPVPFRMCSIVIGKYFRSLKFHNQEALGFGVEAKTVW